MLLRWGQFEYWQSLPDACLKNWGIAMSNERSIRCEEFLLAHFRWVIVVYSITCLLPSQYYTQISGTRKHLLKTFWKITKMGYSLVALNLDDVEVVGTLADGVVELIDDKSVELLVETTEELTEVLDTPVVIMLDTVDVVVVAVLNDIDGAHVPADETLLLS